MGRRKTNFLRGGFYHIYNRGAHRFPIFRNEDDYLFLVARIKKYFLRDEQSMIAYCLMPNHYHFLIRQNGDVSVSITMQVIFNSYTKAFNRRHNHSGTLFSGRFKSKSIESEEQLLQTCRYIHQNPMKGEIPLVKDLSEWPYSNYLEWIGKRNGNLVDRQFVWTYFKNGEEYQDFVLASASKPGTSHGGY